jgi:hypothetical protein
LQHGPVKERKPEQWLYFSEHVPLVVEVEMKK